MSIVLNGTSGITLPSGDPAVGFATGTKMMFVQTAAPTGWTKDTTHDNKALRVVSGTASTGGSVAFTTAFASGLSAGATTLDTTQIPSHLHLMKIQRIVVKAGTGNNVQLATDYYSGNVNTYNTGGGGSHNHTLPDFDVQYVDTIIATKD